MRTVGTTKVKGIDRDAFYGAPTGCVKLTEADMSKVGRTRQVGRMMDAKGKGDVWNKL